MTIRSFIYCLMLSCSLQFVQNCRNLIQATSFNERACSTKSTEPDTKVMRTCLCSFLFEQQILSTSILGCVSVHGIPGPEIKLLFVGSGFVRMESIS